MTTTTKIRINEEGGGQVLKEKMTKKKNKQKCQKQKTKRASKGDNNRTNKQVENYSRPTQII